MPQTSQLGADSEDEPEDLADEAGGAAAPQASNPMTYEMAIEKLAELHDILLSNLQIPYEK